MRPRGFRRVAVSCLLWGRDVESSRRHAMSCCDPPVTSSRFVSPLSSLGPGLHCSAPTSHQFLLPSLSHLHPIRRPGRRPRCARRARPTAPGYSSPSEGRCPGSSAFTSPRRFPEAALAAFDGRPDRRWRPTSLRLTRVARARPRRSASSAVVGHHPHRCLSSCTSRSGPIPRFRLGGSSARGQAD